MRKERFSLQFIILLGLFISGVGSCSLGSTYSGSSNLGSVIPLLVGFLLICLSFLLSITLFIIDRFKRKTPHKKLRLNNRTLTNEGKALILNIVISFIHCYLFLYRFQEIPVTVVGICMLFYAIPVLCYYNIQNKVYKKMWLTLLYILLAFSAFETLLKVIRLDMVMFRYGALVIGYYHAVQLIRLQDKSHPKQFD